MENDYPEKTSDILNSGQSVSPDDSLVLKFRDSVNWGCGIYSIIFMFFAGALILFNRDALIKFFSFFEIPNLAIFLDI